MSVQSMLRFCCSVFLEIQIECTSLREKCPYSEIFWPVFSRIQFQCKKIRTEKTSNMDTFDAVHSYQ